MTLCNPIVDEENSPRRNLETPSRSQVGKKKTSQAYLSVVAIATTFRFGKSLPYVVYSRVLWDKLLPREKLFMHM